MKGLRRRGAKTLNVFLLVTMVLLVVLYRRTFEVRDDIEVGSGGSVVDEDNQVDLQVDFGNVCFVVRTFRGHAPSTSDPFTLSSSFIPSLLALKYHKWVALFVDTDADRWPFVNLASILETYADKRLVPLNTTLVADGMTVRYDTIDTGYNITDKAIRFCPPDSRWLVVTNGDNGYHPDFLGNLTLSTNADIVSVDFHSRYRCDCKNARFCCMPNLASGGWTDLGANIVNYHRFIKEERLFRLEAPNTGQDGAMMGRLKSEGWAVQRVEHCLVAHSPSPAGCQMYGGGYWINHENRCASKEEAHSRLNSGELTLFEHPTGERCMHLPGEKMANWR